MRNRYLVLGFTVVLALALSVPALGGPSNPLSSGATALKDTASKALKKAKKANTAAKAAQSTADQALTRAGSAQDDADAAQTSATGARNAADAAQSTANGAQTAAGAAQASANAAQSAANAAQSTADAALASAATKYDTITHVEGDQSPSDDADKTVVFATCPTGSQATGGGWITAGTAAGQLDARVTFNTGYLTSWGVIGRDGGANASNWSIGANVQCIDN